MMSAIVNGRHGGWVSASPMLFAAIRVGLVLSALLPSLAAATDIIGTSDRDPVSLNESFTLTFSADEEPDGEPDFSPLSDDFQIVNQGQSTQVHMVNGQLSRRTEWKLTALARRAGTLTVPQIAFGEDLSRPFTLTVLPGKSTDSRVVGNEQLMIEIEAEPKNPYVQAQVLYTIRLLHRIALRNGQLDDPKLIDAVVQKLGEDRRYQTERNGHLYGVIERRFAIFPQKSGPLRIEPINLEAELAGGPGSMFDEFFGRQGRIQKIQSEPTVLHVRPIPAGFKGNHWLPAGKLQLEEAWSTTPPETKVGEPITRTLTVKAEGVTMGMVPDLADKNAALPHLQRYPDQPSLNEEQSSRGLTSIRREKTAFIPMKDGEYRVPGIDIAWWNTATDRMEVARVPDRLIKAIPAPQLNAPEPAAVPPGTVETEIRPTPDVQSPAPSVVAPPQEPTLWFWLTWICGFGWLATVLAWWWTTRGSAAAKQAMTPGVIATPDVSNALKSLKRAAAGEDPAAIRRALIEWGRARWPHSPPANPEQLAARLGGTASLEIAKLSRALYGQTSGEWSADEIIRLIGEASKEHDRSTGKGHYQKGLEVMYKS